MSRKGYLTLRRGRRIYISAALSNQLVGVREEDSERWMVSFLNLDLGYIEPDGRFTARGPDGISA